MNGCFSVPAALYQPCSLQHRSCHGAHKTPDAISLHSARV